MRVAVDARHFGQGRGIARYLGSLLEALPSANPQIDWVAVVPRERISALPPGIEGVPAPPFPRGANAAAAITGRPRLDRAAGGADAVWLPAPAPVAWSPGIPMVLSLHDLSWEERPSDFTAYERAWHAAARPRRLARRASRVACVSRATRDAALAAGWPLSPDRIAVIPEAPLRGQAGRENGAAGYLLYVGALEPRKGISTLAGGLAVARGMGMEMPLVVVGQGRERSLLEGLPGVRFAGDAGDDDLSAWYAGAAALVLPSLLEGFGLPPVEAAAFGVPTVASDLPALRETLGDGFIAVPPGDAVALGEAMFSAATDSALRRRVGESAAEAVGRLSWEQSARALATLVREAALGDGQ